MSRVRIEVTSPAAPAYGFSIVGDVVDRIPAFTAPTPAQLKHYRTKDNRVLNAVDRSTPFDRLVIRRDDGIVVVVPVDRSRTVTRFGSVKLSVAA
jgi:hypothetical protein